MKHDYLLLGEVVRPQGIHGEVKLSTTPTTRSAFWI